MKVIELHVHQLFVILVTILIFNFTSALAQTDALYIDTNGNVGIGKQSTGPKLEVDGNIKATALEVPGFSTNALVPVGAIIMWSGLVSQIPTGWALCDGKDGRPDLRSRFIVGYDDRIYNPGGNYWDQGYNTIKYTGGEKDITLGIDELPNHTHRGTSALDGSHTHEWNGYYSKCWCAGASQVRSRNKLPSDPTDVSSNEGGSHQHELIIGYSGLGKPFDGRPPFITLAYIIKVQ